MWDLKNKIGMAIMKTIMESELYSAPEVTKKCYEANRLIVKKIANEAKKRGIYNIVTAARGTSHNAAFCFKYYAEVLAGMSVAHTCPSINNVYKAKIDLSKTMYVVISQSGMSPDTINMLNGAKANGAFIIGVTNNPDSKVAKLSDYTLLLSAGEEKAVAATKTFTTQLMALLMLADALGEKNYDFEKIWVKLSELKNNLYKISDLSNKITNASNLIILSRGVTEGIARECGLKLTETCYKMTFTGSSNEFEHGPKALISEGTPVIMLAPDGDFAPSYIESVKKFKSAGAYLLAITDNYDIKNLADISFSMPECDFYEASIIYAFAVQALACYTATALGLNPDAPRNLKKVTLTE